MTFNMDIDPIKIIKFQIGLEIALFSNLEHFKCIALIKIWLKCAIFVYRCENFSDRYASCHFLKLNIVRKKKKKKKKKMF